MFAVPISQALQISTQKNEQRTQTKDQRNSQNAKIHKVFPLDGLILAELLRTRIFVCLSIGINIIAPPGTVGVATIAL
jgi:hypothetical protein